MEIKNFRGGNDVKSTVWAIGTIVGELKGQVLNHTLGGFIY